MTSKLVALAAPALVLAACGTTEIDAGKTESLIKENIVGPPPKTVDCPEGIDAEAGETFRCELTYEGGAPPATVTVHIVDDEGRIRFGPGDFRFRE